MGFSFRRGSQCAHMFVGCGLLDQFCDLHYVDAICNTILNFCTTEVQNSKLFRGNIHVTSLVVKLFSGFKNLGCRRCESNSRLWMVAELSDILWLPMSSWTASFLVTSFELIGICVHIGAILNVHSVHRCVDFLFLLRLYSMEQSLILYNWSHPGNN